MENLDFKEIEEKWQKKWEESKIFEVSEESKKPKYYVLEMFPYPSASGLHMGHAWNYSIGDILARFKIMNGFNVLHPMGYDALGLPAENAAIKAGVHPEDYTKESIKNYIKQQKNLGLTYDWSRMVDTSSPDYYKWDQWIYLKLLEKGLAYQKESSVNWCPKCNTVLANEQVQDGKCWRHEDTSVEIKHLKQWFLKITDYADELYEEIDSLDWPFRTKAMQKNWIGKSKGTEVDFEINGKVWPVFTTRPDTLFGVTFLVVSAQHLRLNELVTEGQKKEVEEFLKKLRTVSEKDLESMEKEGVFTGSYAINPATNEKVPVYAGNFVVADYGCGMVMAVPAHDQRDFDFAKKYNIPIKQVILANEGSYLVVEKSLKSEKVAELKKFGDVTIQEEDKDWGKFFRVNVSKGKEKEFVSFLENNLREDNGKWYADSLGTSNVVVFPKKSFVIKDKESFGEYINYGKKYGVPSEQLDAGINLNLAYTGAGKLINSEDFSGIESGKAKEKIAEWIIGKEKGRKKINFKLRDWGISRQRYWGTPIPIVHCEKCGAVGVKEENLPVKLPRDVKFGEGNPLETNDDWIKTTCPKCGGEGRRETDTMDTFVNSSWYFLRYCDPENDKKIFDEEKADYWCPIDTYIGGAEHACMHLIYVRFYTKFLRDLGLIKFGEPAKRLFHQGMLRAFGGEKMSKSKGNVIAPETISEKYGIDTARFFLSSLASPDKDIDWDDNGIVGSLRFVNKIFESFEKMNFGKSSVELQSKLNQTIKNLTVYLDSFDYRKATIELRELFDLIFEQKEIDKEDLKKSLQLLAPFCPHLCEELWEKLGGDGFISNSSWPKADLSKIVKKGEGQDVNEKVSKQIKDILEKLRQKGKEGKKVFVYVVPFEVEKYDLERLEKELGVEIKIYSVKDENKYDPENKSKKAIPGVPGIYVE